MKKIILIALTILVFTNVKAQSFELIKARTKTFKGSEFMEFFHGETAFSLFSDFSATPVLGFQNESLPYSPFMQTNKPVIGRFVSPVAVHVGMRLNLIEYFDIVSLSLYMPLGGNLQIMFDDDLETPPFLSINTGIFAQTNFFLGSTKERIDKAGFNLGIGYMFQQRITPLKINGIEGSETLNQLYPAAKCGFSFLYYDYIYTAEFIAGLKPEQITYMLDLKETETTYANYYYSLRLKFSINI